MTLKPADIDWPFFAVALRLKVAWATGDAIGLVAAKLGMGRATFSRARAGRPVLWAHFEKLCAWLGAKPEDFRKTGVRIWQEDAARRADDTRAAA